jgi:hypothetical protein
VDVEAVREAFRSLREPAQLARSPLARGSGAEERAGSVRRLLADAVEGAFGADPSEALTREVLRLGYLDRTAAHEAVAESLHLSRAAYFRRLRRGCERVADYLSQAPR